MPDADASIPAMANFELTAASEGEKTHRSRGRRKAEGGMMKPTLPILTSLLSLRTWSGYDGTSEVGNQNYEVRKRVEVLAGIRRLL